MIVVIKVSYCIGFIIVQFRQVFDWVHRHGDTCFLYYQFISLWWKQFLLFVGNIGYVSLNITFAFINLGIYLL